MQILYFVGSGIVGLLVIRIGISVYGHMSPDTRSAFRKKLPLVLLIAFLLWHIIPPLHIAIASRSSGVPEALVIPRMPYRMIFITPYFGNCYGCSTWMYRQYYHRKINSWLVSLDSNIPILGIGHAVVIFQHNNRYYMADNGMLCHGAKPLEGNNPSTWFDKKEWTVAEIQEQLFDASAALDWQLANPNVYKIRTEFGSPKRWFHSQEKDQQATTQQVDFRFIAKFIILMMLCLWYILIRRAQQRDKIRVEPTEAPIDTGWKAQEFSPYIVSPWFVFKDGILCSLHASPNCSLFFGPTTDAMLQEKTQKCMIAEYQGLVQFKPLDLKDISAFTKPDEQQYYYNAFVQRILSEWTWDAPSMNCIPVPIHYFLENPYPYISQRAEARLYEYYERAILAYQKQTEITDPIALKTNLDVCQSSGIWEKLRQQAGKDVAGTMAKLARIPFDNS